MDPFELPFKWTWERIWIAMARLHERNREAEKARRSPSSSARGGMTALSLGEITASMVTRNKSAGPRRFAVPKG